MKQSPMFLLMWVVILIMCIMFGFSGHNDTQKMSTKTTIETPIESKVEKQEKRDDELCIVYEVTGTNTYDLDIAFTNEYGCNSSEKNVTLPWIYKMNKVHNNLHLGAVNGDSVADACFTVALYINGKLIKKSTGKGPYSVASLYHYP